MTDDTLTLHTVDGVDLRLQLAGPGSRAYAFLIDWHIRLVAAVVLGAGLSRLLQFDDEPDPATLTLAWGIPLALYLLYHPVLEIALGGRTPGKRWAGLRIVAADGGPAGAGALLVRNVFRLIDSLPLFYALGFCIVLASREQVRIGDLAAGTRVVHEPPPLAGGIGAAARVAALPLHTQQLLEEWLARWNQIAEASRDELPARILAQLPEQAAALQGLRGRALRDAVARLVLAE